MKATAFSLAIFLAAPIANAAVIDFESLAQPGDGMAVSSGAHVEDGFQVSTDDVWNFWQTGAESFSGSTALFNDNLYPWALRKVGGGRFDLLSIDLGQAFKGDFYDSISVTFTGIRVTGPGSWVEAATQTFSIGPAFGMSTFNFGADWQDLDDVTWRTSGVFYQFDNIVVGPDSPPAPIPLPAGIALLASGLAVLVGLRRKRVA